MAGVLSRPHRCQVGLCNALFPVGNCFIEVVSPTLADASASRHLQRIGGNGGYMVMVQVDDRAAESTRLGGMGLRSAYRSDQQNYCLTQFHPADCGGLMLSWEQVLHPAGADWRTAEGYWHVADGELWQSFVNTDKVGAMRSVVLAGPDFGFATQEAGAPSRASKSRRSNPCAGTMKPRSVVYASAQCDARVSTG